MYFIASSLSGMFAYQTNGRPGNGHRDSRAPLRDAERAAGGRLVVLAHRLRLARQLEQLRAYGVDAVVPGETRLSRGGGELPQSGARRQRAARRSTPWSRVE
jgi:hypothetical protein